MLLAEQLAERRELAGHAFNFSNEIRITVTALVEDILRIMQSNLQPEIRNEAVNEIRQQYLTAKKAREILQWRPLFSLEEGLKETVRWYTDFLTTH
jgi:CDP-glucose 4,6-dehydratase